MNGWFRNNRKHEGSGEIPEEQIEWLLTPCIGGYGTPGPSDIRGDVMGGVLHTGARIMYRREHYEAPARHNTGDVPKGGCGFSEKKGPFAVFDPFAYRPIVMVLGDTGKKMELTQNEAKLLMEDLQEALEEMEKYMEEKI